MFCFFISGDTRRVLPGSPMWNCPLSGENTAFSPDIPFQDTSKNPGLTIGDYFLAADQFLSQTDFSLLKTGLEAVCKRSVNKGQIRRVNLFLEKHGAFYHPLRVDVILGEGETCSFVLNGAVSKSGLSLVENEYHLISRLNNLCSKRYLPRVFGSDFIKTDNGRVGFFMGEWFERYKEFHVTQDQGKRSIVIWSSDGSRHYIQETSALPIYQEISRILTLYYDLETFEQIFPWHHAAGDFIVKHDQGRAHVKLITIRGYASLTDFSAQGKDREVNILPALLFFFLNLTLRMRLDRLNGIGKTVMLGKKTMPAIIDGFLQALDEKSVGHDYGDLRATFPSFFKQFSLEQITGLMENILESSPPAPSEIPVIQDNLESHCRLLHSIFKND